jgi:hypothetical protein
MERNMTERRTWSGGWKQRLAVGAAAVAIAWSAGTTVAQEAAPQQGAAEAGVDAQPAGGERWLKVVEEDGGETLKLMLVSREYRLANGAGPSVFLTGAVHIADAKFYKELQAFLDAKDVVLFEGVKPPGAGRLDHNAAQGDDESLVKATERRIRFVATFVEKFKRTHKEYPKSLEELVKGVDGRISKILAGCTNDAWGHQLSYSLKDPGPIKQDGDRNKMGSDAFEITSLGADGKPAGDGVDADLSFSDQPALKRGEIVQGEGIQRQLASAMRLKFQLDAMDETKANWRNTDLSVDQVMDRMEAAGADPEQLFSMIGGGSFMDVLLGGVARLVGLSTTVSTMCKMAMVDMLSQSDQLLSGMGGEMGKMMDVIIKDRNRVVLDDLAKVMRDEPDVKTIGIIYGAGHLPDMERHLKEDLGFKEAGETWFTAITVDVSDADMTPADARDMRKMIKAQIERQVKMMQKKR